MYDQKLPAVLSTDDISKRIQNPIMDKMEKALEKFESINIRLNEQEERELKDFPEKTDEIKKRYNECRDTNIMCCGNFISEKLLGEQPNKSFY